MCEECHDERDADYDGESIEAKRRKTTRSIVARHPELGLEPDDMQFRFAPKAEKTCIRVNLADQSPRYEVHVPSYTAQAMTGSPPLSAIAMAAWLESDKSYEEVCDILAVQPRQQYGAFFVSESPPLNPARPEEVPHVHEFEEDVQTEMASKNDH